MNSYFRWYRMEDDLCMEYAEMRLGGQAKIFWENESYAALRRGQPIVTWTDMVQKLRNKYVPRQYESTLFLSWLDLRQGKQPVREYIQAFEECRMRCRFVDDPRVVMGIFMHGLTPRLRNEVLKTNPSEVDEAYRIVEHMERPGEDVSTPAPQTTKTATPSQQTTRTFVQRPTSAASTVQARPTTGSGRPTPATSVGSAPQPRPASTTDSSVRAPVVSQSNVVCFRCKGVGHRISQCPSVNLLIEVDDTGPSAHDDGTQHDDDHYFPEEGLADECDDPPDLMGYIQITPAHITPVAPAYSPSAIIPSAPARSLVSLAVQKAPQASTPIPAPTDVTSPAPQPAAPSPTPRAAATPKEKSACTGSCSSSSTEDPRRTSIFYTYVKINGQACKVIVDSGSCVNAISDAVIQRTGLTTINHPTPYDVSWIDASALPVRLQCQVPLTVSTYSEHILCDILPMKIGGIILRTSLVIRLRRPAHGKGKHLLLHVPRPTTCMVPTAT